MQSYSPHITPYLMAIAEGTVIGPALHLDYSSHWVQFFTNNFMRYDVADVTPRWEGNQNSWMAGTPEVWESMIAFFNAQTVSEANEAQSNVDKYVNQALFDLIATDKAFAVGYAKKCASFDTYQEARPYGVKLAKQNGAPNDSVQHAVGMLGVSIWRFRLFKDFHLAALSAGGGQNYLLSQSLPLFQKLATSAAKVGELFPACRWPTRMAIHDLLDLKKGVDPIKHLSSKARNRILLQCEGSGGFQVEVNEQVVEIATRFNGSSGIFVRNINHHEHHDEDEHPVYEKLQEAHKPVSYYGTLDFGAAKELGERQILGWVEVANQATSEFERVSDKSFLDTLALGATSVSKLILYMNWYFGGSSSWYHTVGSDSSGSLMRQEATKAELVGHAHAMKIDTHFKIADVIACSQLPDTGSIQDLVHHTLDYRRGDIVVYRRKKTVGLADIGGFKPEDCQFQMLDTLERAPKLKGTRWFGDDVVDFVSGGFKHRSDRAAN